MWENIVSLEPPKIRVLTNPTPKQYFCSKEESVDDEKPAASSLKSALATLKDLFVDAYSLLARRRADLVRLILLLSALGNCLSRVAKEAHFVDASYLRKKFEWETTDEFNQWYPQLTALINLCMLADTPVVFAFNSCLHYQAEVICILSIFSTMAMDQMYLIAQEPGDNSYSPLEHKTSFRQFDAFFLSRLKVTTVFIGSNNRCKPVQK